MRLARSKQNSQGFTPSAAAAAIPEICWQGTGKLMKEQAEL